MSTPYLSAKFAAPSSAYGGELCISAVELPEEMYESDATGKALVSHGNFGADIIRFPPGGGVRSHTHPGAHILFCLRGYGYVTYGPETDQQRHRLLPGVCYLIPSEWPHAIDADEIEPLVLIAVGNDHRPVYSSARMTPVD